MGNPCILTSHYCKSTPKGRTVDPRDYLRFSTRTNYIYLILISLVTNETRRSTLNQLIISWPCQLVGWLMPTPGEMYLWTQVKLMFFKQIQAIFIQKVTTQLIVRSRFHLFKGVPFPMDAFFWSNLIVRITYQLEASSSRPNIYWLNFCIKTSRGRSFTSTSHPSYSQYMCTCKYIIACKNKMNPQKLASDIMNLQKHIYVYK